MSDCSPGKGVCSVVSTESSCVAAINASLRANLSCSGIWMHALWCKDYCRYTVMQLSSLQKSIPPHLEILNK